MVLFLFKSHRPAGESQLPSHRSDSDQPTRLPLTLQAPAAAQRKPRLTPVYQDACTCRIKRAQLTQNRFPLHLLANFISQYRGRHGRPVPAVAAAASLQCRHPSTHPPSRQARWHVLTLQADSTLWSRWPLLSTCFTQLVCLPGLEVALWRHENTRQQLSCRTSGRCFGFM
jgi:hypothetical protein